MESRANSRKRATKKPAAARSKKTAAAPQRRKPKKPVPVLEFNPNSIDAIVAQMKEQGETQFDRMTQQDEMLMKIKSRTDELAVHIAKNTVQIETSATILSAVQTQTTATNGRVTKLETERTKLLAWFGGASFVGSGVVSGAIWAVSTFVLK